MVQEVHFGADSTFAVAKQRLRRNSTQPIPMAGQEHHGHRDSERNPLRTARVGPVRALI